MKDFCNATDRDCIRLIVAQDLKESGIDIDSSNLNSNFNLSNTINTSTYHNKSHHHHYHLSNNNNILNTSTNASSNNFFNQNTCKHNQNKSINIVSSENTAPITQCNNCKEDSQSMSKIFGVNLKQIEMVTVNLNEQILTVPSFLKYAIDYINDYIHIEGIFRRNGTASRLKELKKQVEEGIYNFSQFAVFDLTSLIKLFFREMPESLLTFSLYSNFIQAVKLDTTKSKLESILNLCLQLPDLNLHLLIYLMNFLKQVTLQESLNKMNSFNLAVCFAPNIIYTRINKVNDLYINEERIVVQLLIENSSLIGKVSDSVYERSLMLNSLCSTTLMLNNNSKSMDTINCPNNTAINTTAANSKLDTSNVLQSNNNNNDLMFLYDNDLQENSSFIHHGQSAGSTSLSSYCGSSTSKKEKKKRRSSSLKELMITIQNSISKFRRRSASEKNDKTTCSVITCTSMTSASGCSSSISNCIDTTSLSSTTRYDDRQKMLMLQSLQDPGSMTFTNSSSSSKTPICASLYATPRINKRNAEDSLQSTTKKKLMEKLPQRNLLLPNAPITPFSTAKKNKHPFKTLLSTSEKPFKFENLFSPVIRFTEASGNNTTKTDSSSSAANSTSNNLQQSSALNNNKSEANNNILSSKPPIIALATPQQQSSKQAQLIEQTPSTIVSKQNTNNTITNNQINNPNSNNIINVHKQLKYEDSPSSLLINQSCDLASLKSSKYQHSIEKNLSLAAPSTSSSGCCKHSSKSSSSSSSKHHHHHSGHHHHHHHYSSSSSGHHHHHHHHHSSSSKHHHHHHHHLSPSSSISSSLSSSKHSSKHHQYVNAIPSILTSFSNSSSSKSSSNRYINQSDLCTQIITGNLDSLTQHKSSSSKHNNNQIKTTTNDNGRLSYSSSSSSSSSSSCNNNETANNNNNEAHHRSLLLTSCSAADNSMRCTLRRGRPNTPKTGLSVDYRVRKSSVPNTPESKHSRDNLKINYTISNDDIKIKSDNNNSFESTSPTTTKKNKNTKKTKSKTSIATTVSTASLNTAMVLDDLMDEDGNGAKSSSKKEDLDVAFNGDEDIEYEDDELDNSTRSGISLSPRSRSANNIVSPTSTTSTSKLGNINGRQISLSLNNLPDNNKLVQCDSNNDQIIMDEDSNDVTKSLIDVNQMTKSLIDIAKSQSNQSSNLLVKKSFSDFDMVKLNHELELANSCAATTISSSNQDLDEDVSRLPKIVLDTNKQNEDDIDCDDEENNKENNDEKVNDHVKEQQKLVQFEPFKLPPKNIFNNFDINDSSQDDLLQNVLRRQSLFKLKEKINGKVSKQINEIEKRKLSPYRFCNSPLKNKKTKESMSSLTGGSSGSSSSGHITKNKHSNASPLRVPSIFCKKILGDKPEENYIVKMDKRDHTHKLSRTIATSSIKAALEASSPSRQKIEPKIPVSESPLIVRAANQFYKKLNRNRSVKRLNATISNYQLSTSSNNISQVVSNLSSIPENVSGSLQGTPTINKTLTNHNGAGNDYEMEEANNMSQINTTNNSPTSKQLINSSDWQCSESIDL